MNPLNDGCIYQVDLRQRLQGAGLKNVDLAAQLGVRQELVSRILHGKPISFDVALQCAQLLGGLTVRRDGRVFTIAPNGSPVGGGEDPAAMLACAVPTSVEGSALQMVREHDIEAAELHEVGGLVEELHGGHGREHVVRLGVLAWRRRVWAHKVHEAIEGRVPGAMGEALHLLVQEMRAHGYPVTAPAA